MHITIDRNSHTPVYLQIRNQIREMILTGALPARFRLPPERKLAETLGVNRSTVVNAYRELEADGLIASHVGRGTIVQPRVLPDGSFERRTVNPIPWRQFLSGQAVGMQEPLLIAAMVGVVVETYAGRGALDNCRDGGGYISDQG